MNIKAQVRRIPLFPFTSPCRKCRLTLHFHPLHMDTGWIAVTTCSRCGAVNQREWEPTWAQHATRQTA